MEVILLIRIVVIPLVAGAFLMGYTAGFSEHPDAKQIRVPETSPRKMTRKAKFPEQYRSVAESYQELHNEYLENVNAENLELMRREQRTTRVCAKYPTPADSARSLYEYYRYKAREMSDLSSKYSKMAVPTFASAAK